jgi:hypothetical protein
VKVNHKGEFHAYPRVSAIDRIASGDSGNPLVGAFLFVRPHVRVRATAMQLSPQRVQVVTGVQT